MARIRSRPSDADVPPPEQWQGPLAWAGKPLCPVENYSREFPVDATYVRGELIFTLSEPKGPGMWSQTERAVPGLIRLVHSRPVEVHAPGLDGQCWTYRCGSKGRKATWSLYAGSAFPAVEPILAPKLEPLVIEQVVVQSILPMYGTRKAIAFTIRDDGSMEEFGSVGHLHDN